MKNGITKKVLLMAIVLFILTSTNVFAYAFFNDLTREDQVTVYLGDWIGEAIPISTAQEFYDFVTSDNSMESDYYYLTNDLDFTNFTWVYSDDVIFRGAIDGNNHTINNLTISTSDSSTNYFGLFPSIDGATIKNIKFNNLNVTTDSTTLSQSNMISGLITGRVIDGVNNVFNIEILNSSVIGSNTNGTGGIIGQVYGQTCTVNIDSIKATNLKVFSSKSSVGGIIGYVYGNQSTVNVSNIDLQVELFGAYSNVYIGGIIGEINYGSTATIDNVVLDITTYNSFVDYAIYFNNYPKRYIGGIIGYNQTSNLSISNVFITGEMITYSKSYVRYVSTLIARNTGSYTSTNSYYSKILFLQTDGTTDYIASSSYRGVMAELVNQSTLPDSYWWNDFYQNFDQSIWTQDNSGYLLLNI